MFARNAPPSSAPASVSHITSAPSAVHQIPAEAHAAEVSVLGACMLEGAAVLDRLRGLESKHFGYARHRHIFNAITDQAKEGRALDAAAVLSRLGEMGRLVECGGVAGVTAILDNSVDYGDGLEDHARFILDAWRRRQAARFAAKVQADCSAPVDNVDQFFVRVTRGFEELRDLRLGADNDASAASAVTAFFRALEERARAGIGAVVPTGVTRLDNVLEGGLWTKAMTIIGARPGTGKTALGLSAALACATTPVAQGGGGVVFISAELPQEQIIQRITSMLTGIPAGVMRTGKLTEDQWEAVTRAASDVSAMPMTIDDKAKTVDAVRAQIRRSQADFEKQGIPLRLVVVDYLQRLNASASNDRGRNREQEVAEIAKGLSDLKTTFGCAVLALAQLNRKPKGKENERPTMGDLRESGAIENEADAIALLYRPEETDPELTRVVFGKLRGGSMAYDLDLRVEASTGRMSEVQS